MIDKRGSGAQGGNGMAVEQSFLGGIRGHKRTKTVEKQIEKVRGEFQAQYSGTPEMLYLENEIGWEGASKLIFLMAQRNVHFAWNGLRDYGFIRLCRKWIDETDVKTMDAAAATSMIRSILPAAMCEELGEELSALEIS